MVSKVERVKKCEQVCVYVSEGGREGECVCVSDHVYAGCFCI